MASAQQVDNLVNMLDGYVEKGGYHLNVNVLNRETLVDAQKIIDDFFLMLLSLSRHS